MFHGNLEISAEEIAQVSDTLIQPGELSLVERRRAESPYRDRRIYFEASISPQELRFVIRDQGKGFDVAAMPDPKAGNLSQEGGRGLSLMRTFMDEVTFNDMGNEVTMIRRGQPNDSKS
jgi:anti-sigma regulatory factor (Ser/Thr protein kinase)